MPGSLSCSLSVVWAPLCARALLALLRRCSPLLLASSFEMVQIPQRESLIPLARSRRKILTLSAITSPPKLPTTQRRQEVPKSQHEGPLARPRPTRLLRARSPAPSRGAYRPGAAAPPLGTPGPQGAARTLLNSCPLLRDRD